MPKDTIQRAIDNGAGNLEGVNYEECRYEAGIGGGAAVMVDCLTDNKTAPWPTCVMLSRFGGKWAPTAACRSSSSTIQTLVCAERRRTR